MYIFFSFLHLHPEGKNANENASYYQGWNDNITDAKMSAMSI